MGPVAGLPGRGSATHSAAFAVSGWSATRRPVSQGVFSRRLSDRITRGVFAAMFVGSAVLAAIAAGAAPLTLTWTLDN